MNGNTYTAKDLKTIIKACQDSEVSQIEIGDIKIRFSGKTSEPKKDFIELPEQGELLDEDKFISQEDALRSLALTDPVEFDRRLRDGEINF